MYSHAPYHMAPITIWPDVNPHLTHTTQVERLAAGLANESDLKVVALNVDSQAAKYFAKSVLGVQYMPSFVLFPKASR